MRSGGIYGMQLYIRFINRRAYLKVLLWPRGFYSAMATSVLCCCCGNCILDSREHRKLSSQTGIAVVPTLVRLLQERN